MRTSRALDFWSSAVGLLPFPAVKAHRVGMSKAFTREDDLVEPPADAPMPRVPPGETRYVTPEGFRALRRELDLLDPSSRRAKVLSATLPLLTVHAPRCEGRVVFG